MTKGKLDSIRALMCDDYCKWPDDNSVTQEQMYNICNTCPLGELEASAEPLTEEDYTELRDRFGEYVEFVVRDMISGKGERWKVCGTRQMWFITANGTGIPHEEAEG